jgi:hypothetical protein
LASDQHDGDLPELRLVPPEATWPRLRTLEGFDSSASALFDWLRSRVAPRIQDIAGSDYGRLQDEHVLALGRICESGLVPTAQGEVPFEVLALYRWSSGDDPHGGAFACALFLLTPGDPVMEPLMTNGPLLAESCLALGGPAPKLAEQLLVWAAETRDFPSAEEASTNRPGAPDQLAAVLLLFMLRSSAEPEDPRLDVLARMLTEDTYGLARFAEALAKSMESRCWDRLLDRLLEPHRTACPAVAAVLTGLGRRRPG